MGISTCRFSAVGSTVAVVVCFAGMGGCVPPDGARDPFVTGGAATTGAGAESASGTIGPGSSATGEDSGASGGADGESGESGKGPLFDVGDGDASGGDDGGSSDACEKIDFLFVVDNSGSMHNEQESLINSFPGFIESIQDTVNAQDYHIMVVDTDACGSDECPPATSCEDRVGAGRVLDVDGASCGIEGSGRFVTDDQPDLSGTFACLALVGTDGWGYHEKQAEALVESVTAEADPGGCNEGFLRDDAILVVTFITDEEDLGSKGNPAAWKQELVQAKNGDEDAIVMLGLFGNNGCLEAAPAPKLQHFVESFSQGQHGSVCVDDYAPFFDMAVSTIDLACDEFQPEG